MVGKDIAKKKLSPKEIAYYKNVKYDPKVIADYDCDYDNPQYNKVVGIAYGDILNRKPIRGANGFANKADYELYKFKLYDLATNAEFGIPW